MTRKPRKYYTLIARDGSPGCPWSPQFGDYDRKTVADELADYREQGFKRSELRIIETSARQAEIDAAVSALNRECGYYSEVTQ